MKIDEAVVDHVLARLTLDCVVDLYDFVGKEEPNDNWRLACLAEVRAMHLFASAIKEAIKEETE